MDAISTGERLFGERAPGRLASVSGGPPRLAQRLPANQRAPEREERLVDVRPPVVPDAQAAKLTEPGEGAFHDPSPPAQTTPMLCAAHGQQGHDVTRPQTAPNGSRVVAAIPEHTVRPLPRSGSNVFRVTLRNDEGPRGTPPHEESERSAKPWLWLRAPTFSIAANAEPAKSQRGLKQVCRLCRVSQPQSRSAGRLTRINRLSHAGAPYAAPFVLSARSAFRLPCCLPAALSKLQIHALGSAADCSPLRDARGIQWRSPLTEHPAGYADFLRIVERSKHMRYVLLGCCVFAAACAGEGSGVPTSPSSTVTGSALTEAKGGSRLPFKGTLQGPEAVEGTEHRIEARGNATHLGQFTLVSEFTVTDVPLPLPLLVPGPRHGRRLTATRSSPV